MVIWGGTHCKASNQSVTLYYGAQERGACLWQVCSIQGDCCVLCGNIKSGPQSQLFVMECGQ